MRVRDVDIAKFYGMTRQNLQTVYKNSDVAEKKKAYEAFKTFYMLSMQNIKASDIEALIEFRDKISN